MLFRSGASQLEERINAMIPSTIDDILSFADSYDAPEQVEAVFKWDVDDIFYNYFFVGNYIDVGGSCGDDTESIDIYNLDAIRCLMAYQDLNQFFSIDPDEVDYDSVIQEFIDGKLVFTVATTDIVGRIALEDAQEISKRAKVGDVIHVEIKSKEFGRIATQNAKNVILQKIREEEKALSE